PQPALVNREVGGLLAGGPGLAVGGRAPAPAQGEEGRPAGRQARRQVLTALSASASCCYPRFAAPLAAAARACATALRASCCYPAGAGSECPVGVAIATPTGHS